MALKKYIALVIGNSHYDEDYYKNLANPLNEADAIACVFSKLKYEVIIGKDLTYKEYVTTFDFFLQKIQDAKADAAIIYFAGHGLNINAQDCLIMKDTPSYEMGKVGIIDLSVPINKICQNLNAVGNQLNIIIIDACRNDPNQTVRGLASTQEASLFGMGTTNHLPYQTFIAYSTSVGGTASDGNAVDGHSLYTKALLENIEEENLPIESRTDCTNPVNETGKA